MNCFQKKAEKRGDTAAYDDKENQICLNTAGNSAGDDRALKYFLQLKAVAA